VVGADRCGRGLHHVLLLPPGGVDRSAVHVTIERDVRVLFRLFRVSGDERFWAVP
jgi:hypothetical protein